MGELTSVVGRETRTVCRPTHIPLPDGARCAALAPGSLHVLAALDDGTTYVLSWAAVVLFWVVGCRCRFVDTVALYVRYLSKKKKSRLDLPPRLVWGWAEHGQTGEGSTEDKWEASPLRSDTADGVFDRLESADDVVIGSGDGHVLVATRLR